MNATDKRRVMKLMGFVREAVMKEIGGNAQRGGMFAGGLSNEGYAGGYLQALDDIDAALRHGYPSDPRGYWRQAELRLKAKP